MLKNISVIILVLASMLSFSQREATSPYSYYGIGLPKFKGTVENLSMGGVTVYNDSIHINISNPSTFAGKNLKSYDGESRPVRFAFAGSSSRISQESDMGSGKASSNAFDYMALAVPLGKFGAGLGLVPFTTMAYRMSSSNADGNPDYQFDGQGGLSRLFLGLGYQVNDHLSIGVKSNYNFGNVQEQLINYIYNDSNEMVQYQNLEESRSDISGFSFEFGANYSTLIDKYTVVAASTISLNNTLTSTNQSTVSTITFNNLSTVQIPVQSTDVDLEGAGLKKTDINLPFKYSLGVGVGQERHWFLGLDYSQSIYDDFMDSPFNSANDVFVNASSIALGGFIIPNYNSFRKYYKKMVYRAGINYSDLGLKINNQNINEFGINFGVGLPLKGTLSNINLGIEYGERGTKKAGLIKESFFNFRVGFALNSRWFRKRKYN